MIGVLGGLALVTAVAVQMLTYRLMAETMERTLAALWAPPATLLLVSVVVFAVRARAASEDAAYER